MFPKQRSVPSRALLIPLHGQLGSPHGLPNILPPGEGFPARAAAFEAHLDSIGGILLLFLLVCVYEEQISTQRVEQG